MDDAQPRFGGAEGKNEVPITRLTLLHRYCHMGAVEQNIEDVPQSFMTGDRNPCTSNMCRICT
jgi:hypothetical protein